MYNYSSKQLLPLINQALVNRILSVLLFVSLLLSSCAPVNQSTSVPTPQSNAPDQQSGNYQPPVFTRPSARTGDNPGKSNQPNPALQSNNQSLSSANAMTQASASGKNAPLIFVENVGQFDQQARFQVQSGNTTVYFSDDAIWLNLLESAQPIPPSKQVGAAPKPSKSLMGTTPQKAVNLKMDIPGSNAHPEIAPIGKIATHYSFFGGQDHSRADVPVYQGIRYIGVYPGMDLEITGTDGQLSWQFIVTNANLLQGNLGSDHSIHIRIQGSTKLSLENDTLVIATKLGSISMHDFRVNGQKALPQVQNNELIIPIPQGQASENNLPNYFPVSFAQPGSILPALGSTNTSNQSGTSQSSPAFSPSDVLLYSTYIGGGIPINSPYGNYYANDQGSSLAVVGNDVYFTGITTSSDFPAFTTSFGEVYPDYFPNRPFVAKLNINTNQFDYVDYFNLSDACLYNNTYYSATGQLASIKVDSSGNAYLGGSIVDPSQNFPLTPDAIDTQFTDGCRLVSSGGSYVLTAVDGFLAKLDPTGTQLLYASYFGGSDFERVVSIDIDQSGYIYATGDTYSNDMPKGGTVYDSTLSGSSDVFVAKINSNAAEEAYFSYLGGASDEGPEGAALGSDGSFYITGLTYSGDFPATLGGSLNNGSSGCSGCDDGFIVKMTSSGGLAYSNFLGGNNNDMGLSLAVDPNNDVFIAGATTSTDFPNPKTTADDDAFIVELDSNGGSLYTKRLGGSTNDEGDAIALDSAGNIDLVGVTDSLDFPITGLTAFDSTGDPAADLFITKIDPHQDQILYSTYLGGSGTDYPANYAFVDGQDNLFLMVRGTTSADFPTRNAYETYQGYWDMMLVEMSTNIPVAPLSSLVDPGNDCCFVAKVDTSVGKPINPQIGSYGYSVTDLSIPTTSGTLSFQRNYTSQGGQMDTPLSLGWTDNQDARLIFPADTGGVAGEVLFKVHTNNLYPFYDMGDGTYRAQPGLVATLVANPGPPATYTMTASTQEIYLFDQNGHLLAYTDPHGNQQNYAYDANGRLQSIQADGGSVSLTLGYDGQGRIQSVQAQPSGHSVSYHYDSITGDLDSAVDVLQQTWTYQYQNHLLTRVVAPDGTTIESTDYDSQGRAWHQYDGNGNLVVQLTYNANNTTTATDALGHSKIFAYDERHTLVSQTDAFGEPSSKEYDFNFRPGKITDPSGNVTSLAWSADGANLTQVTDALHGQTDITYGSYNNPTNIVDPLKYETKYFYADSNFPNLPTRVESPLSFDGGVTYVGTDYEYYAPGNTDSQPAGKVKLETDALGNQTFYTYVPSGQIASVTRAYGTTTPLMTSYTYDTAGNLADATDEAGVVTHNEYDAAGRLIRTTRNYDPNRPQNDQNTYNLITQYQYDARGNRIAVIDTYGVITRTYYDLANLPITVVQNLTGQTIDAATPPARGSGAVDQNVRTDTVYATNGLAIASIDVGGIITRTYYDADDRPVTIARNLSGQAIEESAPPIYNPASPDQNVRTDTVYDVNGNAIASTDTMGVITRTYYDALNRPITVVQNLVGQGVSDPTPPARGSTDQNIRTDTAYDANGNVIATIDPVGTITRTYYDALNRPITVVQNLSGQAISDSTPPARFTGATSVNIRTDTYYDQAGNAIASQDPRGIVTRTYYDEVNRPFTIVQNLVGQDIYVTTPPAPGGPEQNLRTDIAYDSNGHRSTSTDPLSRVTKYDYDLLGQLITQIVNYDAGRPQNDQNQFNIITDYSYDALGRQLTATDTAGRVSTSTYDALGRLLTSTRNELTGEPQNYQDAYNIITSFFYDGAGNQIAVTDTKDVITRTYYDALNRPMTVVRNLVGQTIDDPALPVRGNPPSSTDNLRTDTSYLGNGAVDYVVDEMGKTTNFVDDALGRKTSTTDPLTHTTSFQYNAIGNRVSMTDANNITTNYEYDGLNRLTAVVENYRAGAQPDAQTNVRTEYTYDTGGNRLSILDGNSHPTNFTYDMLGRLKTESDALNHTTTYEYDSLGNRVSLLDANGKTTSYTYDDLNRLTHIGYPAPDPNVDFVYDALGRRTSMTDGLGTTSWTYDALDRPTSIADPFSAHVGYNYDAVGNRTSLTYPDNRVISYQYDAVHHLQQVSGSGLPAAVTYQYRATGQLTGISRPNGVDTSYTYDDAGQLIDLVHSATSGSLASYHYTYDPVGDRIQAVENMVWPQQAAPSPSPTPTNTPTATSTPAGTATETATSGASLTPTDTPVFTPTDTPLPSDTPTSTSGTPIGGLYQPGFSNNALISAPLAPEPNKAQILSALQPQSRLQVAPSPTETWTPVSTDTPTLESNLSSSFTVVPAFTEPSRLAQGHDSFVVNSTSDGSDSDLKDGICDNGTGTCTLRAAIEQANANPGRDTISFNLPGTGPFTIQPFLALPVVDDPLVIDGTTQPGFAGTPLVVLDGSLAGEQTDGLHIASGGSALRGLVINQFSYSGIHLEGRGGNQIEGNYIGTDASGILARGNSIGILIENTSGNSIGGSQDETRNLISGNKTGLYIYGKNAKGNHVQGNIIGVDTNGQATLGNDIGIRIEEASGNSIGGQGQAHNLIVGNANNVYQHGQGATDNEVQADALDHQPVAPPTLILDGEPTHKAGNPTNNLQVVSRPNVVPLIGQPQDSISMSVPVSFHLSSVNPLPLATGTTFVVNSTGDGADKRTSDGVCSTSQGVCTLRAAIQQANASAGVDTITFNISGSGPYIIQPGSALPTITEAIVINGTTQPGYSGTPIIQLNGSSAGTGANGLNVTAGSSTIRGLAIYRFNNVGIYMSTNGNNHIEGNYIGTDVTGTVDQGNLWVGIYVSASPNNVIGGTTTSAHNLISGNDGYGLVIYGVGSTGNLVQGNYIGTNASGSATIANANGIALDGGASNTTIGGSVAGARNLISGNNNNGIDLENNSNIASTGNLIQGNYIGTNATGTAALGNGGYSGYAGIMVYGATSNITVMVGGISAEARNLISGNLSSGIMLYQGSDGSVVQGNYIGTDISGNMAMPNGYDGIATADTASNVTIGGSSPGAGNLISGNNRYGVYLYGVGANGNIVQGNYIGTDASGAHDLGNVMSGVAVAYATNNTIGGSMTGARNLISGNDGNGVLISESGTDGNLIQGNYIGTDVTGTLPLGNTLDGVHIQNSVTGTMVGGTATGAGNLIAANGWNGGVRITASATSNTVQGNTIGTDMSGTLALGNTPDGISINSSNNQIGGTDAGAANRIAHNTNNGIYVQTGTSNALEGNIIWANGALGIDLNPLGVTSNDLGDTDSGSNSLQNFPVLNSVTGGASTTVGGTLNSASNTTYRLEFFSNPVCDSSGNGEGQTYLGFTNVTTDANGDTSFDFMLSTGTVDGEFVSGTATDPSGNTSEFATCVMVGQSATVTPTNTPTDTPTSTPTYTPTFTSTPTVTATYTPTETPTSTDTFTPTATETYTPTPTDTATPTPTETYTPTPTDTETPTPTETFTPTATDTATFTPTFTPTATPVPTGPVTINYVYDPLNRLTEANYSTGDYYHYAYDSVGNRLTQDTSINGLPSTVNYGYDIANRLTSVNGVNYTWDANGNLINDGANTYAYDSANRLTSFTSPTDSATYSYNGLGDRLQQTMNEVPTNYTLDLNAGLTQVLSDGTTTYAYGFGRISQQSGTTSEYFLSDALGSVRQMTDQAGAITMSKSYDPYGAVAQTSGTGQSAYGYTGEQQDSYSGLQYLRARYYAIGTGEFISRDDWGGSTSLPISFNPYVYAYDNPVDYVDPAGTSPLPPYVEQYLENLRAQTEKCFNEGDLNCVWWNYYQLAVGAPVWGYPHASLHMFHFLLKEGDVNYKPWAGSYDSRWVFGDQTTKPYMKKLNKEILAQIHREAKKGSLSGHIETGSIEDMYPDNRDIYYALGAFGLSAEADYIISNCYSVTVRPTYHFNDVYDWHKGLVAGGAGGAGLSGFQDAWTKALQDAGKAASFKMSGYWSGPNKIYEFNAEWLNLPAYNNNFTSEKYENWYDLFNDIFK